MPRVTVVISCWNCEPFIGRTIASVRAQTLSDWELVIVDDGSPGDFLAAVAAPLAVDARIRVVRQSNGGPSSARNAGHRAAAEDSAYLLFLDGDDCLEPGALERLVAELDRHPEAGMAFCDRVIIDADDREIDAYRGHWIPRVVPHRLVGRRLGLEEAETPFIAFYTYNIVVPSMTLLRRSTFERVGAWDESLWYSEDTDLCLRVSLTSTARYVPLRLVRRRIHGAQLTRSETGRDCKRESQRRFEAKWMDPHWLSADDRRRVTVARRVRDGRLTPYLWFSWAGDRARRHEWLEAARCLARGVTLLGRHGPHTLIGARS